VIEQAKGTLMLVYSLGAVVAFDLLRRRSQETNVKLRRLARQIVRAVDDGGDAAAPAAN
jgi:AmiR/NasT family two-component response regulator